MEVAAAQPSVHHHQTQDVNPNAMDSSMDIDMDIDLGPLPEPEAIEAVRDLVSRLLLYQRLILANRNPLQTHPPPTKAQLRRKPSLKVPSTRTLNSRRYIFAASMTSPRTMLNALRRNTLNLRSQARSSGSTTALPISSTLLQKLAARLLQHYPKIQTRKDLPSHFDFALPILYLPTRMLFYRLDLRSQLIARSPVHTKLAGFT